MLSTFPGITYSADTLPADADTSSINERVSIIPILPCLFPLLMLSVREHPAALPAQDFPFLASADSCFAGNKYTRCIPAALLDSNTLWRSFQVESIFHSFLQHALYPNAFS